ncbi:MAG TPA: hypothetical protein VLA05_00260 [Coriobacteriia bacterium]|nr:hypothetical protein [Coriobacteriia bacterium]
MDRLAIIVRDDNYMRIQTPLSFAYDFAARGAKVDVLFLSMALRALTPEGARSLCMDGRHENEEPWLRQRLEDVGVPVHVDELLRAIVGAGEVSLVGCRDTAEVLNITEADLMPEATGLVDSSKFIEDVADRGIHCMYF